MTDWFIMPFKLSHQSDCLYLLVVFYVFYCVVCWERVTSWRTWTDMTGVTQTSCGNLKKRLWIWSRFLRCETRLARRGIRLKSVMILKRKKWNEKKYVKIQISCRCNMNSGKSPLLIALENRAICSKKKNAQNLCEFNVTPTCPIMMKPALFHNNLIFFQYLYHDTRVLPGQIILEEKKKKNAGALPPNNYNWAATVCSL